MAAAPEVVVGLARISESDESAVGGTDTVDPALVVSGFRVPAHEHAALAQRGREVALPEIGRLTDVAVGVDHDVGGGLISRCHVARIREP